MSKEDIIRKLTSRKFWAMVVFACSAIAAGMGGYVEGDVSLNAALVSVVAYLVAEGAPDLARQLANSTKTTISASSTDKQTVAAILTPEPEKAEAE